MTSKGGFFQTVLALALAMAFLALSTGRIKAQSKEEVASRKQKIEKLATKEEALQKKAQEIKERISQLEASIRRQEKNLAGLENREKEVLKEYFRLEAAREKTVQELTALLKTIWPMHLLNVQSRLTGVEDWAEADRRFTWLASIYEAAHAKLAALEDQARELSINLAEQDEIKSSTAAAVAEINETKDQLLKKRLDLLAEIRKVRTKRLTAEEELKELLDTIARAGYRDRHVPADRTISSHKGLLPWPSLGKIVTPYAPESKPPSQGIGISLLEREPVRAVFWGKVVHNDTLRGFGRVVIVYHGQDYYSLYAFLGHSDKRVGQNVEKDETLGTAGYYPRADGPGVYFELRFHQKPINPLKWLAQLR